MKLMTALACAGLLSLQPRASSAQGEDGDDGYKGVDCGSVSCVVEWIEVHRSWRCWGGDHGMACKLEEFMTNTGVWPDTEVRAALARLGWECAFCTFDEWNPCTLWPILSGLQQEYLSYVDPVTGLSMHGRTGEGWVAPACSACDFGSDGDGIPP